MGMPVRVDVRDGGVRPGAVERVFAWLRFVDATFSPYRAGSEIARLDRGVRHGRARPAWTGRLRGYEALTILPGDRTLRTPGFDRLLSP
jgi:hypothetical protein